MRWFANRGSARIAAMVLACGTVFPMADVVPASVAGAQPDLRPSQTRVMDESEIPIRTITLYRSGVGFFERRGNVSDSSQLQLRFETDQINDILKSMVLVDLDGGRITSVSYGSKEPLARRLASFAVNIADNPTMPELLGRLRGAEIEVTIAGEAVRGTVLGVESRVVAGPDDAAPIGVWHVNLVTDRGMRSIAVPEVTSFVILDEELAGELDKALATLAEYRADRTKTVDLSFDGEGNRRVVVGYVHEMPVWKTSYRLVLPESRTGEDVAPEDESFVLQGWAIVENNTDQDWDNVRLGLVSGRPVSFTMDLYEPLFAFRPNVPVPTIPGVLPKSFAGGREEPETRPASAAGIGFNELRARAAGRGVEMQSRSFDVVDTESVLEEDLSPSDLIDYAAQARAGAVEVGEVFQYRLDAPISIQRQRSAMIPILTGNLTGRRVSIYNPSDGREHPMRGVRVTNETDLQLLPGPIAVFDGGARGGGGQASYAGDATIGHIPPGDDRLLAYALDLEVDAEHQRRSESDLMRLRIVDGVFEQSFRSRTRHSYTFTNKDTDRPRHIVLEQQRYPGDWERRADLTPDEVTPDLERYGIDVAPGETHRVELVYERTTFSRVGVTDIALPQLVEFSRQGKASQAVVDAVREAGRKQREVERVKEQISRNDRRVESIGRDQQRLRENIRAVGGTSPTQRDKWIQKLSEQEEELDGLVAQREGLRLELERAEQDLRAYLRGLNVE